MREIGGYIELETFRGRMLHEEATKLNCGRNALAYLCEAKKIEKLYLPYFLCSSVLDVCEKLGVPFEFYHVDETFMPQFPQKLGENEWLYIVNYYGQLSNETLKRWKDQYGRIIVDNAQSYFQLPVEGVDTLYTCRKFFGVDYLAVSFPRCGEDLNYARRLARDAGCDAKIVAKVERADAVCSQDAMDDIILASDVVMVARGDLGVEIGDPELVGIQKALIRRARQLNRAVITATQMMESMITNPMPTRAEVMDVANAVLDGTDAVMLSAETAAGQ